MAAQRENMESIYKSFFDSLHNGGSTALRDLVNTAHVYMDAPVLAVGVSGKILVVSEDADFEDLNEHIHGDMFEFPVKQLAEEYPGHPYEVSFSGQNHSWLIAKVFMNGVCTASVYAYSVLHPFTESDFEVMDILSKAISLEMMKGTYYRSNRYSLSSHFLSDLLDGNLKDPSLISLRLRNIDWRPKKYMYILAIPMPSTQHVADIQIQILTDQIRQFLTSSIGVFFMDTLVFLATSDHLFNDENVRPLRDMLTNAEMFAGISQPFESLTMARDAYANALNIAILARRLCDSKSLIRFEDYMFLHVINVCSKSINLEGLCHPGVLRIREYDKAHGTSFYLTLQCFLDNALNSSLTAQDLHVHKNTLLYRLEKIRHLADIDFSDGETVFHLQFSIKVIDFMQKLDENSEG